MKEGSSVYTNPDEYGMELTAHIRMLAQSYLSWKQNSPFSVPYGNEQPEEALREAGKSELIEILWRGKKEYASMRQKAVRSAAEHTIIPLEYLFRIQRADDFLCHCAAMALAPELDGGIGELYAEIPENHGKTRPTVELCICLYAVDPERRIGCMRNVFEEKEAFAKTDEFVKGFEAAMEDDFNTADAVAAVFELVKYINTGVSAQNSKECLQSYLDLLVKLCDVLGLIVDKKEELLDEEIEKLIEERQAARKAKNFARADEIRDELLSKGIILKDTREGVQWKKA